MFEKQNLLTCSCCMCLFQQQGNGDSLVGLEKELREELKQNDVLLLGNVYAL